MYVVDVDVDVCKADRRMCRDARPATFFLGLRVGSPHSRSMPSRWVYACLTAGSRFPLPHPLSLGENQLERRTLGMGRVLLRTPLVSGLRVVLSRLGSHLI